MTKYDTDLQSPPAGELQQYCFLIKLHTTLYLIEYRLSNKHIFHVGSSSESSGRIQQTELCSQAPYGLTEGVKPDLVFTPVTLLLLRGIMQVYITPFSEILFSSLALVKMVSLLKVEGLSWCN